MMSLANLDKGIYLVGGAVRDKLIGVAPKDHDYLVVGHTVDEFFDKHPGSMPVGKAFPVFLHNGCEYAFARIERKTGAGHNGFEVIANPGVLLIEDIIRRDITANSIAINEETGAVLDYVGGEMDIRASIIRAVNCVAFVEDPLRVFRVARFAATLGDGDWRIAADTISLCYSISSEEIRSLSPERVCAEMMKALAGPRPDKFFRALLAFGHLHEWFPELQALVGIPAGPEEFHSEGSAFEHEMLVLMEAARMSKDIVVRFGAMVHDFGKGVTPADILPKHHNHDENGVELVKNFCDRLKVPNFLRHAGTVACRYHMKAHKFNDMKPGKQIELIYSVKRLMGLEAFVDVCIADSLGRIGNELPAGERYILNVAAALADFKFTVPAHVDDKGAYVLQERVKFLKEYCKYIKSKASDMKAKGE